MYVYLGELLPMATYENVAFDDEMPDDWEAALEAEEAAEAVRLEQERERKAAQASKAESAKQKRKQDPETKETAEQQDDIAAGTGEMQSKAQDQAAAVEALGGTAQKLVGRVLSTKEERAAFVSDMANTISQHQGSPHFLALLLPNLLKELCPTINPENLSEISSKITLAAKEKPVAKTQSQSRGRNTDMDAFEGVSDRGGATTTDNDGFM
jgi:hypothetical protein